MGDLPEIWAQRFLLCRSLVSALAVLRTPPEAAEAEARPVGGVSESAGSIRGAEVIRVMFLVIMIDFIGPPPIVGEQGRARFRPIRSRHPSRGAVRRSDEVVP